MSPVGSWVHVLSNHTPLQLTVKAQQRHLGVIVVSIFACSECKSTAPPPPPPPPAKEIDHNHVVSYTRPSSPYCLATLGTQISVRMFTKSSLRVFVDVHLGTMLYTDCPLVKTVHISRDRTFCQASHKDVGSKSGYGEQYYLI